VQYLYELDVGQLVQMARRHFARINQDKSLTDADKKQLKEFYLDNFIAPRARKLLQKRFPEDFLVAERPATEQRCEIRRKGIS
jgi:hypothetical protein